MKLHMCNSKALKYWLYHFVGTISRSPVSGHGLVRKRLVAGVILVVNKIEKKCKKNQKSTAPGIPRRSPIQVLTGLDVA